MCKCYNDMSCFYLQGQNDTSMDAELRQVSVGCEDRIESYDDYDVNGYYFHTKSHEETTNFGVCTTGTDGKDYYGIIEEIYQLTFPGCKRLKPVLFKCHWFDHK
jgi:hypothetical protein